MNKQLLNPILLLLICGALLFLALLLPHHLIEPAMNTTADALPTEKLPGTQQLWESLSHQFLTSVQY